MVLREKKDGGLERLLEHCRLSPGLALRPALANPTRGISEVLKGLEEAAFTVRTKVMGRGHRSMFWKAER